MNLTTSITLTAAEQAEVSSILGCTVAQLSTKLNECAAASVKEYLTMIRGQKVLKRGSDMLEYRLFLLIETVFNGKIPDESTVSSLFQTTTSESRALIRAVISKYQYQLRTYIDATIAAVLVSATRPTPADVYSAVINSQSVVDELNKVLGSIDGNLAPVAKKRGSVSTYEFAASSYNELCGHSAVAPNP